MTGALASLTDRHGNLFTFRYDPAGRLRSVRTPLPNGSAGLDTLRYDLDGRLVWREDRLAGGPLLQSERMAYDGRGKLLSAQVGQSVRLGASTHTNWYSGLGNLVGTDWDNDYGAEWTRETFQVDPLGNVVAKRTHRPGAEVPGNDHPDFAYSLDPVYGRVQRIDLVNVPQPEPRADESTRAYDLAGNSIRSFQKITEQGESGAASVRQVTNGRSYYGADETLRFFQEYSDQVGGAGRGVWEEYRYDALGRRVRVETRREYPLCDADARTCVNSTTRFLWDGDQILWELKAAQGPWSQEVGGHVSYSHAGGIDRPLAIWKQGVGSIVTHQNWRGQFARGTFGVGARQGQSSDCIEYPPTNGCIPVPWPGYSTTAWHQDAGQAASTGYEHYWFGSLAVGMRDASGQMYMRNRYYDPQTGQFTQPDPIGLAGGLNSYGFAAGDPVTYSDPYGLSATCDPPETYCPKPSPADWENVARRTGEKLANWGPVLNGATDILLIASPDPGGEALLLIGAAGKLGKIGDAAAAGRVVIGEGMTRVRAHAKRIGADTFETAATNVRQMFRENMTWFRGKMRSGSEVVDIGEDVNRAKRSPFYRAEREAAERRNYPITKDPQP